MNHILKIALRNILRNRRRSVLAGSAIAIGALALLVFGGFTTYLFAGFQTQLVQRIGHISLFKQGYFVFGAGNPAAYGIDDYRTVLADLTGDPVLGPLINVATPTQSLIGIASNSSGATEAAKTFLGIGLEPQDRDRMRQWNEFGAGRIYPPDSRLAGGGSKGLVGGGLARILGLCAALKLDNCPAPPIGAVAAGTSEIAVASADLAALPVQDDGPSQVADGLPRLDLLSATAGGAPNIVTMSIAGADPQGVKELDDNYVAVPLGLAQELVYGRGMHKATGLVLQLKHSEDLGRARARLADFIQERHLDLEIRDFAELTPYYVQVVNLFSSIFLFMAAIMALIVLFAVVNTMTMNVMERTNEIGTIRALGGRRSGIRRQFVLEGALLGAAGASIGLVLAVLAGVLVNAAQLTWIPPANVSPVPFRLDLLGRPSLLIGTWIGLVLVASLAALLPANRAARLPIVDALRHV
jgi:putative ABC transport system permease protein